MDRTLRLALLIVVGLAPASDLAAQQKTPIAELRITLQDMKSKELIGSVVAGETVEMKVGDEIRLRMVAIPVQGRKAPRYPSTRFEVVSGAGRVSTRRFLEEEGSAIIAATRVDDPRDRRSRIVVRYRVLEPLDIDKSLLSGTIEIRILEEEKEEEPPPAAEPGVVTLYSELDYQGRKQSFSRDVEDLDRSGIGNDRVRSVRIPEGCSVTLFRDGGYQGSSTVLTEDVPDLSRTRVGNDSVSSMRIDCTGGSREAPGVVLYSDMDYRGAATFVESDTPFLARTAVGNDRVRSVRVPDGCEVTLYENDNYGGESTRLTSDAADLSRTRVGNDRASSVRVNCR